jgi:hypothetical protein
MDGGRFTEGWTGLVAVLLDIFGRPDAKIALETSCRDITARFVREQAGNELVVTK